MTKILVTGASGFIGSHLCRKLIAEGHEVHGITRRSQTVSGSGVQWWTADIADYSAVCALLRSIKPKIVFHLASRVNGSRELSEVVPIFEANLASTVHILTCAVDSGCEKIVLSGSSEEPQELDGSIPCSPYAVAKWSSTAYARMFHALFRTAVLVPRIFMTYGPGQPDVQKVIPYTILSILRREKPRLSSGQRLVDWIYIDDVVQGLIMAAFMPNTEMITFDLGSGSMVSVRAVAEQIAGIIGNGTEPIFGAIPDRPMEQQRAADLSFMEQNFRWKPRVSLRDGLEQTIEWYRRNAT